MDICTVNFTTENEGIQREKAALKSHFDKRPDLHTRLHQVNEQTPSISKQIQIYLQLLSIYRLNRAILRSSIVDGSE